MKIGDKLRCIKNSIYFNCGQDYEIIHITHDLNCIYISYDPNSYRTYCLYADNYSENFVNIIENRKMKLNKINESRR